MSISVLESCKKRKRRPKLFGFRTFMEPGCPISPIGSFRDNVRMFLSECGDFEDYQVEGMSIWCTLLVHETSSIVVPLYTIEEQVKHSPQPYCDQCRCNGWSNHFVSKRKYHWIIPIDGDWKKPLEVGAFDLQTHLLHGLIHCNGLGHLLCINGIEGGSSHLCGREVMSLWDRICTNLRACKVTVEDVSKKNSMDLRLLHGVAYGHPWFGRWGYKFFHGSFGVREHNYNRAIEILSSLELDNIIQDFSGRDQHGEMKKMFCRYRDMSETLLLTLKDLLRFMLTVKSCASAQKKTMMTTGGTSLISLKSSTRISLRIKSAAKDRSVGYKRFSNIVSKMDSRWSARRLESAAQVIVNALLEKRADSDLGCGGMSRQEVRDAARMHIGDTGLLDYVLKSMNNVMVGSHIVHRAVNPATRLLEYTIHDHCDGAGVLEPEPQKISEEELFPPSGPEPGSEVHRELIYLYINVLLNYPDSESVALATQTVLDSKHFIKDWQFKDTDDQLLRFKCHVMPSFVDSETLLTAKSLPGELVVVPLRSTVLELKHAAERALRDTYCIMENLVVTDIENIQEMDDRDMLFGELESGSEVWIRGYGIDSDSKFRYEGGIDKWIMKCACGAEDDDGERMVACDICEVWQHTRCLGIEDSETLPPLFVCSGCCSSCAPSRTESSYFQYASSDDLLLVPETEYMGQRDLCINDDVGMRLWR